MKSTIQSGRTSFDGIVAEFWLSPKPTGRMLIICDGAPGLRSKHDIATFLARKGYSVFQFRYRGTWESEGEFLRYSPARDVDDVISGIQKGFQDLWTGVTYYLDVKEVVVLGASFGGPAAIHAALNPLVSKSIAFAPVVDWSVSTKQEPFSEFVRWLDEGFPGAYRCPKKNFKKLLTKKFYNPVDWVERLDGTKIFLMHAKDDTFVSCLPARTFAKKIGARYVEVARGGHLGSGSIMEPVVWKKVAHFLAQ